MKYLLFTLLSLVLFSCSERSQIRDYYLFSVKPSLKLEIEKLQYDNDSVAVAKETERAEQFISNLPQSLERTLAEQIKSTDSEFIREAKRKAIVDAYSELSATTYFLIRISHDEDFNPNDYINVVKEYGLNSNEVRNFIDEHKLDVFIKSITP